MGDFVPSRQIISASSYWSHPEKIDFPKFIAHFGTDFGAISTHMGTKTEIMVKNHFLRQTEEGRNPDLLASARKADARRRRGHSRGPPPLPTPIVKRKFDNPATASSGSDYGGASRRIKMAISTRPRQLLQAQTSTPTPPPDSEPLGRDKSPATWKVKTTISKDGTQSEDEQLAKAFRVALGRRDADSLGRKSTRN